MNTGTKTAKVEDLDVSNKRNRKKDFNAPPREEPKQASIFDSAKRLAMIYYVDTLTINGVEIKLKPQSELVYGLPQRELIARIPPGCWGVFDEVGYELFGVCEVTEDIAVVIKDFDIESPTILFMPHGVATDYAPRASRLAGG